MIICTNCGYESPESANFCPKCGNKLEHKEFCASCGGELVPGMPFCPACGAKAGTAPKADAETVPPPAPAATDAQDIIDFREFEEPTDPEEDTIPMHGDPAGVSLPLHYKNVWFVAGERKLMNAHWFVKLDVYSDHMEYQKKLSPGNVFTGGLGAVTVSSSKAKKTDRVSIPFSQITKISFEKESGLDGQKLIHIYMKDGSECHLALVKLNVKENERLYRLLRSLAAPYMA